MMKSSLLFSAGLFLSSLASASAAKGPSEWSKLTGASVLLEAASNSAQSSALYCNLAPEDAKTLRSKLDKRIEATTKSWASSHKKAAEVADPAWPVTCLDSCSCGLDASLLEKVGLANLGTQDRWIFRRVSTLALEQTPGAAKECAARQTWFCESTLMKQLRRSK